MNKKIEALIYKAGIRYGEDNVLAYTTVADLGKFAELVVRQCAYIAEESDDTWTGAGPHAAQQIKESFGVR
jgi:hypothetical protein